MIGYLSFRSGLRGSYFALVTLAFAEVLRIVANAAPFTGGAAGTLIKLDVQAGELPVRRAAPSSSGSRWHSSASCWCGRVAMERSRFGA